MLNLIFGGIVVILAFVFVFVSEPYIAAGMSVVLGGLVFNGHRSLKSSERRAKEDTLLQIKREQVQMKAIRDSIGAAKLDEILKPFIKM